MPRHDDDGSKEPHLVMADERVEILLTEWTMLYLRCRFLKFLGERRQDIYHLGGETCFSYVETQKSCHATYHRPVMAAATADKACRSKNFNLAIIRNSYDRKLVVASTKIRELHSVFTYHKNIFLL